MGLFFLGLFLFLPLRYFICCNKNCWCGRELFTFFQITRRYAEFSGAVMVLHEKFPLEGVDGLMLQLQDEVEKVILKMAAVFQNRKDQLIFLINNYDMMLSVLSVSL